MTTVTNFILTIQCVDKPGIVAFMATTLANCDCNIEESAQYHDPVSGQFFMRVVFSPLYEGAEKCFEKNFSEKATPFEMQWSIKARQQPIKTLILTSKTDHCLNDLLYRTHTGHLNIDITAIASNHEDCRSLADRYDIPYHYLPITPDTKQEQESAIRNIIEETDAELILLARYMQILTPEFCADYMGRVINIHHAFLPGFKGAKPYHQAHARGVKIIGATAHFATVDLDEGPIISQDVVHIDHSYDAKDLQALGRDTEARVLSDAAKKYTEHRIFLNGERTVIL